MNVETADINDQNEHDRNPKRTREDTETAEEREIYLKHRRNQWKKRRDAETAEEREIRLAHRRSQWKKKRDAETIEEREMRKNVEIIEEQETHIENNRESELSESDKKLLNTFPETCPDNQPYNSSDLGSRNIDLSYNWARKSKE
ncbi:1681_t:CDS:2 [Cetraspora pellucida]|uniref:1681_t:CDS:1 n=1 Tax=Cetraspora pellucida TaxID=1433469 RepID=A0ACA9KU11_9GLOM|nr:1681_t:CDS:2 [Cetraspora pellucida]